MAVAGYPAANATGAAAKIASGDVLAGVTGTAGVRPSDCASDGSTGCVATATYPAANSTGAAAKIASGDVLAGITGTAGVRPSDCSTDGGTGCVAVTNFPAVDKLTKLSVGNAAKIRSSLTIAGVVGTLDDCSTDGGAGCVAVGPAYAAAITAGVAAKVLTGQSVAGISGSATSAPANCAADGATNCVAVTNFPAVNKVTNLAALNLAKISSSVTVGGVVGTMADCSADGTTGCLTVTAFPSANTSGAAAKIISGQTLAGISGSATAAPSNCAADGATGCVAVALFPAVDKATKLSAGNAAKIRSSLTIAGVVGTLDDCATDGGSGCVVTGPTYVSALTTGAAAKILSGQSLAGVLGSAAARPSDCASDGDINCVAVTNFPAVNRVTNLAALNLAKISSSVTVGGVVGTLANCSADGTTSCLTVTGFPSANTTGAAAKILTGQTLAGVSGSAANVPANCSSDGQTDCVAITTYPALQKSLLTAAVLKNGTVINGVTGTYPNASNPLAGSTATADLTNATFNAQVKSTTAFEYFDSTGALQSGAGDDDITAAKIVSGISIFGTTGTAAGGAPDPWNVRVGTVINGVTGQLKTSCRNRTNTSIWNTSVPYTASTVDATADTLTISSHPFTSNMTVRVGASTAPTGITINSTIYYVIVVDANTIRLSASSGPGAQVDITAAGANVTVYQWSDATLHWWDTIDDSNNDLVYPTSLVSGWSTDTDCDYSNWQDLTTDGTCDSAADDCIMKDRISGLTWSESFPVTAAAAASTTRSWQNAIQHCNDLGSFGGQSGWRLPTQKELLEAWIHGIRDVGYNGAGTIRGSGSTHNNNAFILSVDTIFWSASAVSARTTHAWSVNLGDVVTDDFSQSFAYQVLCVR